MNGTPNRCYLWGFINVRFGAHYGLMSDIALSPKSAPAGDISPAPPSDIERLLSDGVSKENALVIVKTLSIAHEVKRGATFFRQKSACSQRHRRSLRSGIQSQAAQ
jgi:hypothetical protein